ncbi:hypothetical protein A9404_03375 [Halothiobacillus diazotrophicus]|uniref:DUF2288 domain-containing protein n=1 Tax=Halothiobacillus diazotrophicus TaxID=1860122 RepID=A0A191ZF89_9GAMM|nr:DUF2288 family protein [Halothiobacillus diazotrophicus]ANJ66546.1 hypothetical protein A9404_03375 [Halothiobacillus diazotrophicus]
MTNELFPDDLSPDDLTPEERWSLFAGQTARIEWRELAPLFARGQVVLVDPALDLVDVAVAVADDNKSLVESWMQKAQFGLLDTKTAGTWAEGHTPIWAVVVHPWVLAQARQIQ